MSSRARQASICMAHTRQGKGAMESNVVELATSQRELSPASQSTSSMRARMWTAGNHPLTAWPRPVPSRVADLGRFSRAGREPPRGGRHGDASRLWQADTEKTLAALHTRLNCLLAWLDGDSMAHLLCSIRCIWAGGGVGQHCSCFGSEEIS